jgi:hypothetical protein
MKLRTYNAVVPHMNNKRFNQLMRVKTPIKCHYCNQPMREYHVVKSGGTSHNMCVNCKLDGEKIYAGIQQRKCFDIIKVTHEEAYITTKDNYSLCLTIEESKYMYTYDFQKNSLQMQKCVLNAAINRVFALRILLIRFKLGYDISRIIGAIFADPDTQTHKFVFKKDN